MEPELARSHRFASGRWRLTAAVALIALIAVLAAGPLCAKEADADLLAFFAGHYELIGRAPDGGAAYSGTMEVTVEGGRLRLSRTIGTARSTGTARLEERTADRIRILTVEMERNQVGGAPLEAWCAIGSDLDNGPRLTCLVRPPGVETARPGLEAWFWFEAPSGKGSS